jgi:3-hydroxyisobutyrate dehydrogenase
MSSASNVAPIQVKHIGYLGMGIMGSAMASNLLKAGYTVTVWNRTLSKCDPIAKLGAKVAPSPKDVAAAQPDLICINVTDTPDVEAVIFGENGILAGINKHGKKPVIIDHSTINPVATQAFAKRLQEQGIEFVDAPVSGGDVGARNATLSIMVGGSPEAFETCKPMFEKVGKSIIHMGPAGMGQVCKACNQIAVSVNLLAACEAMAMAQKCGLDLEKMIQVISGGAGGSWQLANLGPRIAKGDMAPGFMIDLVLKDLAIVAEAARARGVPLAGTALAETYFRSAQSQGAGKKGTQAMSQTLESMGNFRYKE